MKSNIRQYLWILSFFIVFYHRANGKVFTRCEFAQALADNGIQKNRIGDYVCLAENLSGLNSSRVGVFHSTQPSINTTYQYGVFQAYVTACKQFEPLVLVCTRLRTITGVLISTDRCPESTIVISIAQVLSSSIVPKRELIDDDLADDISCAQQVLSRQPNFSAWKQFAKYCEGKDTGALIQNCTIINVVVTDKTNTLDSNNSESIFANIYVTGPMLGAIFMTTVISLSCCFKAVYGRAKITDKVLEDLLAGIKNRKRWELEMDYLCYDTTDVSTIIGSGQGGVVVRGTYKEESVAIKFVNSDPSNAFHRENLYSLISEFKILANAGEHPNIIRLIAACTTRLSSDHNILVVVELCPFGDLLAYLVKNRRTMRPTTPGYVDISFVPNLTEDISLVDMLGWSCQIANAMCYLSSVNVIHGDLAARNVLLMDKHTIKVTDFGLSQKMYHKEYVRKQQKVIPFRWLAPESLEESQFSTSSDVWSFGVILWEIFSFGQVPYSAKEWSPEFVKWIKQDENRLGKPNGAPDYIYTLMLSCWQTNHSLRPTFEVLRETLGAHLSFELASQSGYSDAPRN